MAALPASGGVRSLLAKFENNNNNNSDVSPPSRGRPSGESDDSTTNRPLSKVRASFVSVERNSQGSPTPGFLRRNDSYGTDKDSAQRSDTVSPSTQLETASTNSLSTSPQKIRTALATLQRHDAGDVNGNRSTPSVNDTSEPSTTRKVNAPANPPSAATQKPSEKASLSATNKQPVPSKTIKQSSSTPAIAKDVSTSKSNARSTPSKGNKSAAPPTRSATVSSRPAPQPNKPAGSRTTATVITAPGSRSERVKTPSHDASKNSPAQASPRTKAGSKSPTRPVRLPASLTTPTAASAAKTGNLARSQSHANLRSSPRTDSPKTLSRKPSTLRPDVSRLAAHSIPDRPKSRVSTTSSRGAQEEGFLARMMRPTASSASKMHEKIDARSPPRLAKAAKITGKNDRVPEVPKIATSKHKDPVPEPVSSDAVEPKVEKPVAKIAPVAEITSPEVKTDITQPEPIAEVTGDEQKPSVAESPSNANIGQNAHNDKAEPITATDVNQPVEEIPVEEQAEEKQSKEQLVEKEQVEEGAPSTVNVQEQPQESVEEATAETDVLHEEKEQPVVQPVPEVEIAEKEPEQPIDLPAGEAETTAGINTSESEHPTEEPIPASQEPSSVDPSIEKEEEPNAEATTEEI